LPSLLPDQKRLDSLELLAVLVKDEIDPPSQKLAVQPNIAVAEDGIRHRSSKRTGQAILA
jgi:hypothetical protein